MQDEVKKLVTKFSNKVRNALKKEAFKVRAKWDTARPGSVTLKFDEYELYFKAEVVNYIDGDFSVPNVQLTLVFDMPTAKDRSDVRGYMNAKVLPLIEKAIGRKFSDMPWYFEKSARFTLGGGQYIILGKLDAHKTPYQQQEQSFAGRYDPRQEYFDRMTPAAAARYNRVRENQFASDFGGCAANYRF